MKWFFFLVLFISGCYKGHECLDWSTKEDLGVCVKIDHGRNSSGSFSNTIIQTEKIMIVLDGYVSIWWGAETAFVKDCNDRRWFAYKSKDSKTWRLDLVSKLEEITMGKK